MFKIRSIRELSQEELLLIPPELNESTKCLHCARLFREIDNFGRLACRLHPGVVQNDSLYSCCKRPIYTSGCLRSDHISTKESLSIGNEYERHTALQNYSVIVIPSDYFYYGINPPLQETILWRSNGSGKTRLVKFVMPFNKTLVEEFDTENEKRELQKKYKKLPLLAHHYKKINSDVSQKKRMANAGWRNDISPNANDDYSSSDDEGDEEKDLEKLSKIDIPFVIIRRFV